MKIDGVSAIAVILIASFAIDRVVTGVLFALSFLPPWLRYFPEPSLLDGPARIAAERKLKLVYFVLAAGLGVGLMAGVGQIRIFSAAGFPQVPWWIDALATGLILVGGADRVAAFLNLSGGALGGSDKPPPAPIQITGRLVLEDPGRKLPGAAPDGPPSGG